MKPKSYIRTNIDINLDKLLKAALLRSYRSTIPFNIFHLLVEYGIKRLWLCCVYCRQTQSEFSEKDLNNIYAITLRTHTETERQNETHHQHNVADSDIENSISQMSVKGSTYGWICQFCPVHKCHPSTNRILRNNGRILPDDRPA